MRRIVEWNVENPKKVPAGLRRIIMGGLVLSSPLRPLPEFCLIGAQRAGTTSLYSYLIRHPCIMSAIKKEIHFFDSPENYGKGIYWYRAHFPTLLARRAQAFSGKRAVSGEATPYYLFHPGVPERVARVMPEARFIVLLRNPVERAYSHYHHSVRYGYEELPFDQAIEREEHRLAGETQRMADDRSYLSFAHLHHSYAARGIYADQIENWLRFFRSDQFLFIKSEDLYQAPPRVFSRAIAFLGLPEWQLDHYSTYNAGNNPSINVATRERLSEFFEPHNQRLYRLLDSDFGWG